MAKKLSTSQAAKRLNLSRTHIARLCAEGKLNGSRVGPNGWWKVELPEDPKKEGTAA